MTAPTVATADARRHLAACFEAIDATRDAWAARWRIATRAERLVLLRIAGGHEFQAGREWDELSPAMRAEIKRRAVSLHEWLGRVIAEAGAEGGAQ